MAVEAALVLPILALMVFGLIEMGLLIRDAVATTSAARVGARIASASADAGPGTCDASSPTPPPCTPEFAPAFAQAAADAIQRNGTTMPEDSIEWVMVYEANAAGFPLPAANRAYSCSSNCVRYVWDSGLGKFRFDSGSWRSASVNACVNHAEQDSIGVALRTRHDFATGLFGAGVDLTERSVMRFEPLPVEQCLPDTHP